MTIRCINIDWLEVYCFEPITGKPRDAQYFDSRGIPVSVRDHGTRQYREMFTVLDEHGQGIIEVRRSPFASMEENGGFLPVNACHIRLTNFACYCDSPVDLLRDFLTTHGYTIQSIFRIDICLDFSKFDSGDFPEKFIKRYVDGKYTKINQTRMSAYGTDQWDNRTWQTLSWGNPKSMVTTKVYNKTRELIEVKDKPYIRWAWYLSGLVDDPITCTKTDETGATTKPDIWRLEFSIKSNAKRVFVINNMHTRKKQQVILPHTLDCYDNREKLWWVFQSLAYHYFYFKHYEEGTRKDRCRDKRLWTYNLTNGYVKIATQASNSPISTREQRLYRLLTAYRAVKHDPNVIKTIDALLEYLEHDAVANFKGETMTEEEILKLQYLLNQRAGRKNNPNIETHRKEVEQMIHDFFLTDSPYIG